MSSVAYLDVTFNKTLTLKEGTNDNLKKRFDITVATDQSFNPISLQIINNRVRLKIDNSKVPQPGESLKIEYTQGAYDGLTENQGALVDSSTGYPISSLVAVITQQPESIVIPTSIRPTITSAVVEHEDPKTIVIKFTPGRDVSSNSIKGTIATLAKTTGEAGYGITPKFELGNQGAYSSPTWIDGSGNTVFETDKFATLKITTGNGEIQNGMGITLDISGFNIADQFDLSMNDNNEMTTLTSSQFTNNVKRLNVDNAYISNIDPSSVIIYFKAGDVSGVDMSGINLDSEQCVNIYKVFMDSSGTSTQHYSTYHDVSGVKSISYDSTACDARDIPNRYKDVSGIRYELHEFPFKYNNNNDPSGIKIKFDLNRDENDNDRIRDVFGNECFNSRFDTKSVNDGGGDISGILVTNLIKGIKINDGKLDVSSGEVYDLSYNVILNFKTNGSSPEDISGILVTTNATDFSFNNITTGKIFNPDDVIQLSDPSRVQLYVDYSKNTFDNMITEGDIVTLSYINTSWPSSIKDKHGNFMLPQLDISVNNTLDGSGNIKSDGIKIRYTGTIYDEIDISYNVDICLNYIDGSNNIYNNDVSGGFLLSVDDPPGVEINEIETVDLSSIKIKLNKGLYATSLPILTYENYKSIIRNAWGPKLKNETLTDQLRSSLTVIKAPRQSFISNTGKFNEFGIIDISFSEPIHQLGNGSGFKYAVGYSDSIADLSTNSFIAIPTSDVSLNDSSGIRLNTGYNQSGGVRGFSKQHTEGSTYHITIKYEGHDASNNRPKGANGYLPNFSSLSMDDASNNIFDPSCNPSPLNNKPPTAIIRHDYPNVVYVAMQQPAYNEGGTVEFYDISNINLIDNSYNTQFNYHQTDISSTKVSYEEGKLRIEFPIDLSGNDLSLNYINIDGIRDQNGGILQTFTESLDICSNILWCDVSGSGDVNGDGAKFETGYPFIHGDTGNVVYCKWDPDFTDFEGTPHDSYYLTNIDGGIINCISQAAEQKPDGESVLKLTFNSSLYGEDPSYNALMYKKPVGKAGIRLGPQKLWVRDFSNNVLDNSGQPTMTITATNKEGDVVTSGVNTSDAHLNLRFISDISTNDFSSEDISSNGTISNFQVLSETEYDASFVPQSGNLGAQSIIEVEAGAYTTPFEKGGRTNIADTSFNWTKNIEYYYAV